MVKLKSNSQGIRYNNLSLGIFFFIMARYKIKRFSARRTAAEMITRGRKGVINIMSKTPGQNAQEFSHDLMKNAIDSPIIGGGIKGGLPGGTLASPVLDKIADHTEKRIYNGIKVGGKSISDWTKPLRKKLHKKVKPISEKLGQATDTIVDNVNSGNILIPGVNM